MVLSRSMTTLTPQEGICLGYLGVLDPVSSTMFVHEKLSACVCLHLNARQREEEEHDQETDRNRDQELKEKKIKERNISLQTTYPPWKPPHPPFVTRYKSWGS